MSNDCYWIVRACLSLAVLAWAWPAPASDINRAGTEIYLRQCASCHGQNGEGVAEKHDEPLFGERSLKSLTRLIERTMPEDDPDLCVGDDAAAVAAYIFDAFYSPQAAARNRPARIELSRLTIRQYENAVADLIGSFRPGSAVVEERGGLSAEYYDARNFRREKRTFERIDPRIDFDFGEGSPDERIGAEEFAIRWRGSVVAEESGDYEFVVKTRNGVRLWVNDDAKPLIDEWVSSGNDVREYTQTIRLLGGRAYPVQLEIFKFKEQQAAITLLWKPPHKTLHPIPAKHLAPARVPETMVVTTAFPPDDGSLGYERGTAVSKEWGQAATFAAIEAAGYVIERLDALSRSKAGAADRESQLKQFCMQLAERAFRRPLSEEQRRFFIESQFAGAKDLETAVKRVVLLVLKSPRFLYPEIPGSAPDDYTVAARLALGFWDSIPDRELFEAAAQGKLRNASQIRAQADRMLHDPRTRAKMRDFFDHWLDLEEAEDISKDPSAFPDFNDEVLSDMRSSLELFIDHVVWSDRSDFRQLLLADYLFLNQRLAQFFGATPAAGEGFEKIAFGPDERAGVVTHPLLLTTFAYHKNTSPIHRGVFLTRKVVGRSLRPPPQAIEFLDGRFDPSLTMREKVHELTSSRACQSCHSIINPLGFSLEHFDAVGRWRTMDNQKLVDAASAYPTSDGETIPLTGARDVAEHAAGSAEAHRAFIRHKFHHFIKQAPEAYAPDLLETLRRDFADSEFNMQKLLAEIVQISATHGLKDRP
jgi:hypothetical protein